MEECSDERVLYDYFTLRELYMQRRRQIKDIFNSRTWRMAKGVQKILGAFRRRRSGGEA